MATLKCLASGSSGNAYIIECANEKMLVELGIGWKDVLRGLNYDLSNITACLVTHAHNDHSKSVPNALKSGLSVHSCQDVANTYKGVKIIPMGVKTKMGGFKVQPLPLTHNVECIGFLITHDDFGKLLFCTDCATMPYKVKDCNHILIEANYSDDKLIDNMCNNVYSQSASENHLEIEQCVDAIKRNYSTELQNVVLLHLSGGNSDEQGFINHVKQEIAFDRVYVAQPNLIVELQKSEF